jgi:hypothetical protein
MVRKGNHIEILRENPDMVVDLRAQSKHREKNHPKQIKNDMRAMISPICEKT